MTPLRRSPGQAITRHVIAVSQMLVSALLIHLTGGRIETHFHVFGSLAFLTFYRDWRVLVTATIVVALDHFLRGTYWPQQSGRPQLRPESALLFSGWPHDLFGLIFLRQGPQKQKDVTKEAFEPDDKGAQIRGPERTAVRMHINFLSQGA